jgi:hypothetical protein
MNTLNSSWKPTDTHTERCDSCGLWYSALHPARDGRDLCRLCLELEGQNRWGWRPLREGRDVGVGLMAAWALAVAGVSAWTSIDHGWGSEWNRSQRYSRTVSPLRWISRAIGRPK